MQSLSQIVGTALVIDVETGNAHRYADIYAAKQGQPKKPYLCMRDLYAFEHPREYRIVWPHGIDAYYLSRQAPWQITPGDIEKAYARAKRVPLITEGNR